MTREVSFEDRLTTKSVSGAGDTLTIPCSTSTPSPSVALSGIVKVIRSLLHSQIKGCVLLYLGSPSSSHLPGSESK